MYARGWRGVLIEPNPEEYQKIPAERPNSISVNAAICDRRQDVHFVGRMAKGSTLKSAGDLLPVLNPAHSASPGAVH